MENTQQNHSNALDEARRKNEKRQQPNSNYQQSIKNAEIQSQERLQPSSNHQQELEDARKKDEDRQQPSDAREKYDKSSEEDKKRQHNNNPEDIAKKMTKAVTPMGVLSVLKQASLLKDMPFVCAFGFALLKDALDVVENLTVAFYILSLIGSILCSIFIFMMLLLAGSSGKKKGAKGFAKKIIPLIGGGAVDALPGIGVLPIETITVCIIYVMVLFERAEDEKQ